MEPGYETVEVTVDDGVATVALNRPAVRNAFNARMVEEIASAFVDLGSRQSIRLIVLRGNGPVFGAGADVTWMSASLDFTWEENVADAQRLSDMLASINDARQPVIARVHGAALGGAMGLIAACDLVVAADNVVFGFTEVKLGIVPAVISRFVVPKIGEGWARALFLTGERFTTDLAQRAGLVHWSVAEPQLDKTVSAKAGEILASGPRAVREAKALIASLRDLDPSDIRDFTAARIAELRAGEEGQEGLRAFLEKRMPSWRQEG